MKFFFTLIISVLILWGQSYGNPIISWYDLMDYNSDTGKLNHQLNNKLAAPIKLVGFIVPLMDDTNFEMVKEFYLVPDPMMCIHVPPPPPNQMVHVIMEKPVPLDSDLEGIWIYGTLETIPHPIEFGDPGFRLKGKKGVPCDDYPYDEFIDPLSVLDLEEPLEPPNPENLE